MDAKSTTSRITKPTSSAVQAANPHCKCKLGTQPTAATAAHVLLCDLHVDAKGHTRVLLPNKQGTRWVWQPCVGAEHAPWEAVVRALRAEWDRRIVAFRRELAADCADRERRDARDDADLLDERTRLMEAATGLMLRERDLDERDAALRLREDQVRERELQLAKREMKLERRS